MPIKTKRGFTLIELMISLLINAMLFVGLVDIFATNLQHYRKVLNNNQLREQLQSAVNLMSSEVRRAGYWINANNDIGTSQNNNPFQASATDIAVNVGNNCVIFSYDRNGNGTLPTISASSDDERYGFRVVNNTLQTRPPGSTFSCSAGASEWENMTDPTVITITSLTFTLNTTSLAAGPSTLHIRSVDISLTGRLASDATVTRTITQHVRVRNDKFVP